MDKCSEKYSKLQWTQEQEAYLKELKQVLNIKSWKFIAGRVNEKFVDKNRNGKQCRQRYMNYVRFTQEKPKILGWSQSDDYVLFDKFLEFGAKWVQISSQMPGRSENCLKNRFYGALRRVIRKINRIEKEKKLKYKKSIKYDSLMRILSYKTSEIDCEIPLDEAQKSNFFEELRKDLIKLAVSQQEYFPANQVLSLIVRIHQFNCRGRTSYINKARSITNVEQSPILSIPRAEEESQVNDRPGSIQAPEMNYMDLNNQQIHTWLQDPESNSFISMINENNIKYKAIRNLEEQLYEILNEKYAPEDLPCF